MLGILINSLKTGVITEAEPLGAPVVRVPGDRFQPMHGLRRVRPRVSDRRHPSTTAGADRKIVTLSAAACIQCRACVTECPEQAVSVSHAVEVAAYTREQLARSASFDIDPGHGTWHVRARRTRAPHFTNPPIDCATGSAVGSGARFMCARWTRKLQCLRDGDRGDDEPSL